MQFLKSLFPFSFRPVDTKAFIMTLIIYAVIGTIAGSIIGVFSHLWLIGWIFRIICSLIDLYVLVGVVLTILSFTNLIE